MSLKSKLKLRCPMRPAGREPQSIKAIILNKSRAPQAWLSILIPVWQAGKACSTRDQDSRGSEGCRSRTSHTALLLRSLSIPSISLPRPSFPLALPPVVLSPHLSTTPHIVLAWGPTKTQPENCPLYRSSLEGCLPGGSQIRLHISIIWHNFTCPAFSPQDFHSIYFAWDTGNRTF